MKVALLIRSLELGGAERQIGLLAAGLQERGHEVSILTFYDGGRMAAELQAAGVTIVSLGKSGRWGLAGFTLRLLRWLRAERPTLLYGFMPTANLMTLAAKLALPGLAIVWGIRSSFPDLSQYDRVTRITYAIERKLARLANRIISNSHAGLAPYVSDGYPEAHAAVIPNGVDTNRFRPLPEARQRLRASWNVGADAFVIGIVARLDPMKDHATFIAAAARVAAVQPQAIFAVVGGGDDRILAARKQQAEDLGIADRIIWAGPSQDMPAVYNALDLLVLSSAFGEGFPNVLIEALACGTACVSTDTGEAADIIGAPERIVPPLQPTQLAAAILHVMQHPDAEGQKAERRESIIRRYSVAALASRTENVFLSLQP